MGKYSISFILIVLIFGLLIGAVVGSLLHQVFGLEFLNWDLFPQPVKVINDFYIIKNLELQLTPATLLGFVIAVWLLYRTKEKN